MSEKQTSDLKEIDQIIRNVRRLSNFIDIAYLKTEKEKFNEMQSNFNLFKMQIELLYRNWFPTAKKITDEAIINHLYKDIYEKDAKIYVKFSIQCLLNSVQRVFDTITSCEQKNIQNQLIANIRLLEEIAFEAPIFLQQAFKFMENQDVDFGHGKRNKLYPRETLNASEQILRRFSSKNTPGDFAMGATATFLIRQAIELWLQEIFGIRSVWDDKEKKFLKLQPERLFELLDNAGKIVKTTIPKKSIQRIHNWTQTYVHVGLVNAVWEIENAQHFLRPIFYSENVLIKKEYYQNIESQLQEILKNPNIKLNRVEQHSSKLFD